MSEWTGQTFYWQNFWAIVAAFERPPQCIKNGFHTITSLFQCGGWYWGALCLTPPHLCPRAEASNISLQCSKHLMPVDVISCCCPFWARRYYPKNICICPPALWVVNGVCKRNLGSQQEASLAQQGSNRFWNCVWTLRTFWDQWCLLLDINHFAYSDLIGTFVTWGQKPCLHPGRSAILTYVHISTCDSKDSEPARQEREHKISHVGVFYFIF